MSGVVIVDATSRRSTGPIRIEVDEQIAVDPDIRKLLDDVRDALGDALRGKSTPELERMWSMTPIVGSDAAASTSIELTSNGGAEYIGRIFDRKEADIVPRVIDEWIARSAPDADGVDTPEAADTSGGQIPRTTAR